MNLPNQLTVGRFFLTLVFVVLLSTEWRFANTAGLLLFAIASVTDYLDGEIARRRNLVTDFGKLMDPLADKIMMAAAFILLVPHHAFPAWVAIAIISREFLITGLRLLAASKGVVLPAEKLGKHKTIWQIVMVLYFFLLLSLDEMQTAGWFFIGTPWAYAWKIGGPLLIGVVLILTIFSGGGYVKKNWKLITSGAM
ncbi:MAG: pgsA [Chthoniobacteraceae bacterium]|nr:pgsA [Chthoniobacteraceae bacterium]MDB6172841.1 pgsA [Chthoniobacteraceae bacterium]